jgi:hypothetical protein
MIQLILEIFLLVLLIGAAIFYLIAYSKKRRM